MHTDIDDQLSDHVEDIERTHLSGVLNEQNVHLHLYCYTYLRGRRLRSGGSSTVPGSLLWVGQIVFVLIR